MKEPLKMNGIKTNRDIILNSNILFTPQAGLITASPPWLAGRKPIHDSPVPDLFAYLVFIKRWEWNQMRQPDSENMLEGLKTVAKKYEQSLCVWKTRCGGKEIRAGRSIRRGSIITRKVGTKVNFRRLHMS